jgi:hypothetical protein
MGASTAPRTRRRSCRPIECAGSETERRRKCRAHSADVISIRREVLHRWHHTCSSRPSSAISPKVETGSGRVRLPVIARFRFSMSIAPHSERPEIPVSTRVLTPLPIIRHSRGMSRCSACSQVTASQAARAACFQRQQMATVGPCAGDTTHKLSWAKLYSSPIKFMEAVGLARPRTHKSAGRTAYQSPLCPDSDQILQRSEMTRWAKTGHA